MNQFDDAKNREERFAARESEVGDPLKASVNSAAHIVGSFLRDSGFDPKAITIVATCVDKENRDMFLVSGATVGNMNLKSAETHAQTIQQVSFDLFELIHKKRHD